MATRGNMKAGSGVRISGKTLSDLHDSIAALTQTELLVGFPDETADRKNGDLPTAVTNAALAYIHDNGAPEQNIPARPFMIPALEENRDKLADALELIAKRVVRKPSAETVHKGFMRAGLIAQAAIRNKINEGIPPPLAAATLRARARRGKTGVAKAAQQELDNRALGQQPSTDIAKPLVDTGQLRNAVNFVIRPRKRMRP